jgi:hypothetical protein
MPPSSTPSVYYFEGQLTKNIKAGSTPALPESGHPQYWAMNMADANVFVDHFPEAPAEIEE